VTPWRDALAGRTLRAIAAALTAEGIPTPSGRAPHWDQGVVRYILNNPIYWGQPMALRRQLVPVEPHLRGRYRHKSRPVTRPVEEQVPLPADFAPLVVSAEVAARVHARLTLNQRLATPKNPDPQELLRGIVRCGYCGRGLLVARLRGKGEATGRNRPRTTYRCRMALRVAGSCRRHGMEAHKLDAAVWAAVADELQHPERIRRELEEMRASGDPSRATLDPIERQLGEVRRKIANKRKYAEAVDDDREREEVAAEVTLLRRRERDLETEHAATLAHFADWEQVRDGLARTLDWTARVAGNLDAFTFAERRQTLLTLGAEIVLYGADRRPRVELSLCLPLSGIVPLGGLPDGDSGGAGELVSSTP
jgi:hypothetical protein